MKKLLLIDNYDSFTYNLVQYFQELGVEVEVFRNNKITLQEAQKINPDFLVFSPGPGTPNKQEDIGIGEEFFKFFRKKIPILGVCLGHQMMGNILGGEVIKIKPVHGKRYPMKVLDKKGIFKNFPEKFEGMRYHSLVIKKDTVPDILTVTVKTDDEDEEIMAFENIEEKIFGVQFHPESIGTKTGINILKNFLSF